MDGWWLADFWSVSPALVVSWVFWVILSITLHELAHGVAAIKQGDRTPIELGHMTWNPLVHMGPWSLIAFLLLGLAWGAMPVNPSRFRSRHGDAIVAAAGPATNLGLWLVCSVLLGLWSGPLSGVGTPELHANLRQFFFAGASLNMVLMLFNLLPVPPLDGFRIVCSFHPPFNRIFDDGKGQFIAIVLFALMWIRGFGWLFAAGTISSAFIAGLVASLFS